MADGGGSFASSVAPPRFGDEGHTGSEHEKQISRPHTHTHNHMLTDREREKAIN